MPMPRYRVQITVRISRVLSPRRRVGPSRPRSAGTGGPYAEDFVRFGNRLVLLREQKRSRADAEMFNRK